MEDINLDTTRLNIARMFREVEQVLDMLCANILTMQNKIKELEQKKEEAK